MELYPFQKIGRDYLHRRERAALCDQQGLGKTPQALMALEGTDPVLVVCPRIVRAVWVDHFKLWRPHYGVFEIKSGKEFRWPGRCEAVIVNYDLLPGQCGRPPRYTTAIADEAHYTKAPTSRRGVRFRHLAGLCRQGGGRTWLLTGTPMPNDPPDLWYLMLSADLAHEAWGTWANYRKMWNPVERVVRRGHGLQRVTYWAKKPWPEVGAGFRTVALRRTRSEVLPELPPKHRRIVRVKCLNREATKLADDAMRALRRESIDPETALMRLVGGPEPPEIAAARRLIAALKVRACGELMDELEPGAQCVVFSQHRAPVEALSVRQGWGALMGGMGEDVRAGVVRDFQAGTLRGIAATIGAAATGITLTAASEVLFVDLAWTPAANAQAEDRVCRIGQTRGITIHIIQAEHEFDEIVVRVLAAKQARSQAAIG